MPEDDRRVPDPDLQDLLTCQGDGCGTICIRHGEKVVPHVWRKRETMAGEVKELFCVDCAIKVVQAEHGIDRDTARNHVMEAAN